MLNFELVFYPLLEKFVRGTPSPMSSVLVRHGYFLAYVKYLGYSTAH